MLPLIPRIVAHPSISALPAPELNQLNQIQLQSNSSLVNFSFRPTQINPFITPSRVNTFLNFIPEKEVWIIERFGKFNRIAPAGINFVIPFLENISYVHSLKEITVPVDPQPAVTSDNVQIQLTGNIYIQIVDPWKASYNIANPVFAVTQLAQTALRSVCGKMTLDETFENRDLLNKEVLNAVYTAAEAWGINVLRYELNDILPPQIILDAMARQAQAERKRREQVLDAEGDRESAIKRAEGQKEAVIAQAIADAERTRKMSDARAYAVNTMVAALAKDPKTSEMALNSRLASEYIEAFAHLAGHSNTMILSEEASDITKMVAKSMAVINNANSQKIQPIESDFVQNTPSSNIIENISQSLDTVSDQADKIPLSRLSIRN